MTRRRYQGGCAVDHTLDRMGNRWSIPIIRELLFGGMRFSALKSRLPGIGPNILSQRLTQLEELGLVQQRQLPQPVPANIYELTDRGFQARQLIINLARWAVHSPDYEASAPISAASLMILLESALDPAAAKGIAGRVGIVTGQDEYVATISAGQINIERRSPQESDALICGSTAAICQFAVAGYPLDRLQFEGRLEVSGDLELVRILPAIFRFGTKHNEVGQTSDRTH